MPETKTINEIIYLPNEIFTDLQSKLDTSKHIAFAYSYYYYISYLYRYCKYLDDHGRQTQQQIKAVLGYAATNKSVDFIIKRGGILDQLGYTETTTDFPLSWSYDSETMELRFETILVLKQWDDSYSQMFNDRNFRIKKPLKAFNRQQEDSHDERTGTFYNVHNTHGIHYDIYNGIIQQFGCMGFYLYGFLKHKCDIFGGYQASQYVLCDKLRITSSSTLFKYTNLLRDAGYIQIERKQFYPNSNDRVANVYKIVERTT